jgi:cytochrome c oxidase subunit IV
MYPKGLVVYNSRIIPHILFSLEDLSYLNVEFSLRKFARHALVVVMEFKLSTSAFMRYTWKLHFPENTVDFLFVISVIMWLYL